MKVVEEIKNKEILTESGIYGVSKYGKCKFNDVSLYSKLLSKLQELDKSSGKNKNWKNQARDVLIAETCIKNNLILVTNDGNLRKVMKEFNGHAKNLQDFLTSNS